MGWGGGEREREHKNWKKNHISYEYDTPVTLKQGQGNQTWYKLVDPKECWSNTKFEKPHLNSVHEKANNKVFVKSGNISIISLEYVQKVENSGKFMICMLYLTVLHKFQLKQIRTQNFQLKLFDIAVILK